MPQVARLTEVPANWEDPIFSREQAVKLLAQPHHILLAVADNGREGHLLASIIPHAVADILTLYVPQAYRRRGHALELVKSALTAAKNAGCTGLTLEVAASNTAAINLYSVCGLQQVSVRANYYLDPVSNLKADALVLAVSLA